MVPPGVIDQVDRRRRAFLWAGTGTTNGAKCLVAWERVCDPKEAGGLGLGDLGVQNVCMMLKLIHKLHHQQDSSWARWVQRNASIASLTGDLHGQHWDMLRLLLPTYRAITTVILGDGQATSFWHDVWHEQDSMAEHFPQLYTHCRDQEKSVMQAVDGALQSGFVCRRSGIAQQQFTELTTILQQVTLQQAADKRISPMLKKNGDLDTSLIYKALRMNENGQDVWAKFIWQSKAPPRVQFFACLLSQGRIQCRANLAKKKVADNAVCEVCQAADETAAHVIFGCNAAKGMQFKYQLTKLGQFRS